MRPNLSLSSSFSFPDFNKHKRISHGERMLWKVYWIICKYLNHEMTFYFAYSTWKFLTSALAQIHQARLCCFFSNSLYSPLPVFAIYFLSFSLSTDFWRSLKGDKHPESEIFFFFFWKKIWIQNRLTKPFLLSHFLFSLDPIRVIGFQQGVKKCSMAALMLQGCSKRTFNMYWSK